MSSSSILTFCFVASLPVLCLATSLYLSKAFNYSFPKSLGATREVQSLSRYVLNSHFMPFPICFASALGYTWLLRWQTTFLRSPWKSALIGAPLKFSGALVVSQHAMSSSSPFSMFHLVAPSPLLRFLRWIQRLDGIKYCFLMHPRACRTTNNLVRNRAFHWIGLRTFLPPLWRLLSIDLNFQNLYMTQFILSF